MTSQVGTDKEFVLFGRYDRGLYPVKGQIKLLFMIFFEIYFANVYVVSD